MNITKINRVRLNTISLNSINGRITTGSSGPKAPEGSEVFRASDGALMASDGVFYVKLTE